MKYNTKRRLRRIAFVMVLALLFVTVVAIMINGGFGSNNNSETVIKRLPVTTLDDAYAYEMGMLCLDGTKLTAIDHMGEGIFASELPDTDYKLTGSATMVIAYKQRDLIIMDEMGNQLFNQVVADQILSVKCGGSMYAIASLDDGQYRVNIYDLNSDQRGDTILFPYQSVLSIGWYGDNDDQLWTLALDSHATLPESRIVTYHPGKSMTGYIPLVDEITYACLPATNTIYTVGTRNIGGYSYTGENLYENLIYGWALQDMRLGEDSNASFLLAPADASETGEPLSMLWYIHTDGTEHRISLPPGCISAKLTKSGIMVLDDKGIYTMNIDGTKSEFTKLTYVVDAVGAYTNEDALALSATDGSVFFIPAP